MFRKPKKTSLTSSIKEKKISSENDNDEIKNKSLNSNDKLIQYLRSDTNNTRKNDDNDNNLSTAELIKLVYKEKQIKKRKFCNKGEKNNISSSIGIKYQSLNKEDTLTHKDYATLPNQAEKEIKSSSSKSNILMKIGNNTSNYTGINNTRNKFLAGPIKAPRNIRTTCRFDYQPDICKDYKETGFCGYGDTCIYLHDRGDFMTGWQLENNWYEDKKKEEERIEKEIEKFNNSNKDCNSESDNNPNNNDFKNNKDQLPFACYFCRDAFKNPVVTLCQHYFCHECVLIKVKNGKSLYCPICKRDTNNVFNHPYKLEAKKRRLVGLNGTWEEYKRKLV